MKSLMMALMPGMTVLGSLERPEFLHQTTECYRSAEFFIRASGDRFQTSCTIQICMDAVWTFLALWESAQT
jgi:hypothetical protein